MQAFDIIISHVTLTYPCQIVTWSYWYTSYCLPLLISNCSKIYFWKIFATKFSHKFWIMRLAWWGSTINLLIMANCLFWKCYKWQQWLAYSYLCLRAGYMDTWIQTLTGGELSVDSWTWECADICAWSLAHLKRSFRRTQEETKFSSRKLKYVKLLEWSQRSTQHPEKDMFKTGK